MKNIHVLPTDKPSRIYLIKSNNKLGITSNNPEFTENFGSGTQNQNLFITSDEEIKQGDWFIDIFNVIHQTTQSTVVLNTYKKIILTTDQNLIKYGVQSIDDDFLEWFVKNPSCESVEVVKDRVFRLDEFNQREFYNQYKITIPKEEPKQETLEEVAEIILHRNEVGDEDMILCSTFPNTIKSMVEMAKWQQERSYSEEDILKFSEWISHNDWVYLQSKGYWVNEEAEESEEKFTTKELFNKSKKK